MSACENLPQELLMAIVHHIRDDQNSLKAFSLVCKAWTNPARDHLFASLTIAGLKDLEKIKAANITSTFTHFLRHLQLWSISDKFWNGVIAFLADFKMPRIRSLLAGHLMWHSLSPAERSTFLCRFESIISLQLGLHRQDKPSDIATIICAFPHLEKLVLMPSLHDYPLSRPSPLSPQLRLPERLYTLHVMYLSRDHQFFLEWLGSVPGHLSIHTFRMTDCPFFPRQSDYDAVNLFLKALGPSLEVFGCEFHEHDLTIDLSYNTHLRSIDFRFRKPDNLSTNMLSVVSTLSLIASQQLEQVAFSFHGPSWRDGDFSSLRWNKADEILAGSQFAALKRVHISGVPRPHDMSALSTGLLPTCHARGFISFVDPPTWYL